MEAEEAWLHRAASKVREALDGRAPWWALHRRGTAATLRTNYRQLPLPAGFEVRMLEAAGARRRLALAHGEARGGRPILLLPGLYAHLNEGLFLEVTSLLHSRLGRSVALLEDRFAPGTIRLNGDSVPTLRSLGAEVAAVASALRALPIESRPDCREPTPPAASEAARGGTAGMGVDETETSAGDRPSPDVIAFSAGAAAALSAPEGTFSRAALWSAAVDPRALIASVSKRRLVDAHFRGLHRRCFEEAGLRHAPPRSRMVERLASDRPLPPLELPLLAVHASDDPVAPVSWLASLTPRAGLAKVVVRGGGHLGFGALAGDWVYGLPFEE